MASFTAPALPYFCNPDELPGPLPTLDEIEATDKTLPCIWKPAEKRIVVVRDLFVVKYGIARLVTVNEGHALMVLRDIPTVPRLYAMYHHGDKLFLIIQYLPGRSLDQLWGEMSEYEKTDVTKQLHDTFELVRGISPPTPPMFGNIASGPVPNRFFMTLGKDPAITGPFGDEAAFHDAIALHLRQDQVDNEIPPWSSDFLQRHFASAMGRHACVFTHGDIQRKNILVFEATRSPRWTENGDSLAASAQRQLLISGVIDWESAGWMPSYWEYATMFVYANWSDDWTSKLENIVEAWPNEAAMLMFVRRSFDGF